MSNDATLMERAVRSDNLQERAVGNQKYGTADFGGWVESLIDSIRFESVLDVCCGTGNQLVLYAARPEVKKIHGIDLSQESLDRARDRLAAIRSDAHMSLSAVGMERMFALPELKDEKYDLISCFYGLYYAEDVQSVLEQMQEHLSPDGTILVVGPHGKNNSSIFGLLRRHFSLPEKVVRSATTFMEQEVCQVLERSMDVRRETFVNPICFPEPEAVIDYWRASTFFEPDHEPAVIEDIYDHCDRHGKLVIEKHVMACVATKR